MSIVVTGGAGFIGSNFVLDWFRHHNETLVNIDKLTYAGNLENLVSWQGDTRHRFVRVRSRHDGRISSSRHRRLRH